LLRVKISNAIITRFRISLEVFPKLPSVYLSLFLAVHDFEADQTDDLFFSIKPYKSDSLSYVPLLVRTHWRYTRWRKISFSILVEDRTDLESGYYQVDTGSLGNCETGKSIQVILPTIAASNYTNHKIFLHGFEISTQLYSPDERSPF
jgi:hypothetical protein